MPVVAAYHYRDGVRVRSVAIDERVDCAENRSEGVIIVVCLWLYDRFRKTGWL